MEKIIVKGKLQFIEEETKEYSRNFTAILEESSAFQYGNGTQVRIIYEKMNNGKRADNEYIDTRYAITLKKEKISFEKWIEVYFHETKRPCKVTIF